MPRTALTVQTVNQAGTVPTYAAANADGHTITLVGGRLVHVKNGGASAVTVTVPTPQTVGDLAVAERTHTIAAGAERMFSLGDLDAYRQSGGGNVAHIDFSAVTSVTIAAFDVI